MRHPVYFHQIEAAIQRVIRSIQTYERQTHLIDAPQLVGDPVVSTQDLLRAIGVIKRLVAQFAVERVQAAALP